ncbi:MAG: WYL domain-containing protein [Campylobacterota bacterium]|nr:WYL domain-containing protein [Campylobacterota bacterium]
MYLLEDMDSYQKLSKGRKMEMHYENIISIFEREKHSLGLTLTEIHHRLQNEYRYTQTDRALKKHLIKLSEGEIDGIVFTWVQNGKHKLKDYRHYSNEDVMKHLAKIESKDVLYQEERTYMRLAMEAIKELKSLSSKHHQEIEKRLGTNCIQSPYFIDNADMESVDMSDIDILDLKYAISIDAPVEFKYIGESRKDWYYVEPYKLIIFDGLWYLYGKDINDTETPYKTWRLIYIKDVDINKDETAKHKMAYKDTESILNNADDADFVVIENDAIPTIKKDITFKLKIDAVIVDEFNHKAHIPGEVETPIVNPDNSLIITTKVNTYADIDHEIKAWIPYIEILEPVEYRLKIIKELEVYRKRFSKEIGCLVK